MWEYTDKVIDHFLHPRNVGEVQDPDGIGEVGAVRRAKSRYNLEPVYLQTLEQIESFLFFFKTALQMIVLIERVARKNIRERDKGLDNFMPNRNSRLSSPLRLGIMRFHPTYAQDSDIFPYIKS
jgi:hypothetical protein